MRAGAGRAAGAVAALALALALAWGLRAWRAVTLYEGEGTFGAVRVVERADGSRALFLGEGRAVQTALVPGRPLDLVLPYTRPAAAALASVPPGGRLLFVGLGGGALPSWARAALPDVSIDVVEIDPLVVEVAMRYFAFEPDSAMRVHVDDGRAFIEAGPPRRWDAIVLDAFSDDEIPEALTTREFLEAVRGVVAPDGLVLSNLWTRADPYAAMVATYRAVFDDVALLAVPGRPQVILLAGPRARIDRDRLASAAERLGGRLDPPVDLAGLVTRGWSRPAGGTAPVLRDRR